MDLNAPKISRHTDRQIDTQDTDRQREKNEEIRNTTIHAERLADVKKRERYTNTGTKTFAQKRTKSQNTHLYTDLSIHISTETLSIDQALLIYPINQYLSLYLNTEPGYPNTPLVQSKSEARAKQERREERRAKRTRALSPDVVRRQTSLAVP